MKKVLVLAVSGVVVAGGLGLGGKMLLGGGADTPEGGDAPEQQQIQEQSGGKTNPESTKDSSDERASGEQADSSKKEGDESASGEDPFTKKKKVKVENREKERKLAEEKAERIGGKVVEEDGKFKVVKEKTKTVEKKKKQKKKKDLEDMSTEEVQKLFQK